MKKTLLFVAILIAGVLSIHAQDDGWQRHKAAPRQAQEQAQDGVLVFGYCQDFDQGIGTAGPLKAAIEIPAETAAKYAGASLTKVRIALGTMSDNSITLFLTNSLTGTSFYSQKVSGVSPNGWNEIALSEPYVLDGQGFFIGYEYARAIQGKDYPVGTDNVPTTNQLGDNIYSQEGGWEHIGNAYGSICIRALLEGDNLPENCIELGSIKLPFSTKPGDQFVATVDFVNMGTRTLQGMDVQVAVEGKPVENAAITVSPSNLASGNRGTINISGLQATTLQSDVPVKVSVPVVNGQPNESDELSSIDGAIASFTEGVKRMMVVEEWTGTWCGWCPRGIVGMAYMRDNYPDDFIGIAVHDGDRMVTSSYQPFLDIWAPLGYPNCCVNRDVAMDPNAGNLSGYYRDHASDQTFVSIDDLTASLSSTEKNTLDVSSTISFTVPVENGDYRMAYVIKEDHVGPYAQNNYYAGGGSGKMDGWEKYGASYYWYFDEVARRISDAMGTPGSVPAKVEADSPVTYSTGVSTLSVKDMENSFLVALVINGKTGHVINGKQIALGANGVDGVTAEGAEVVATEFFTLDGRRTLNPDKGIYIVRKSLSDGSVITSKTVVR